MSTEEHVPDGSRLAQVYFQEGPLGVTLRRRAQDGIVYVHEIISDSQATALDIELGDELWKVNESMIGTTSLDKEAWQTLVQYIKACPRPLSIVWRRRFKDPYDDSAKLTTPPRSSPISSMPTSTSSKTNSASQPTSHAESSNTRDEPYKTNKAVEEIPNEVREQAIESQPSDNTVNDAIMAEIVSQFYVKEIQKASLVQSFIGKARSGKSIMVDSKALPVAPYTLSEYSGRRLLKFGEMTILSVKSSTISISQPNKIFVLLSDVLIVCVSYPNDVLLVEECINLQVCKVRTYLISPPALVSSDTPAVFDLMWPNGSLQTGFMTDIGKEEWMQAIYQGICASIGFGNDILGWKHQHMLGTVHAAVVLRDAVLLQSIADACERQDLEFSLLEAIDDAGYTPLHYASIFRFTNIIHILHSASANHEIPDRNGLTCLHWSSMLLEDDALEILTEHSIDVDVRDYDDRTPLFLVMVEGRDKSGKSNINAMKACAERLLDHHAEPNVADHHGYTILHYLSASWMYELVDLMLQHNAEIMAGCYDNGMTPLHLACRGISLRRKISEATVLLSSSAFTQEHRDELEDKDLNHAIPTIKSLLRAGSRPNYKDSAGKTPLHHIAEYWDTTWGDSLAYAVITLLTFGARIDDSPQCQILKSRLSTVDFDALAETRLNAPTIDADALSISSYDPPREAAVQQYAASDVAKEKPIPSCVLCSVTFTLFRRQHHCRMCNALCCDECSKRRVILQGKEVRACDSCYNRVAYAAEVRQRGRVSSASNMLAMNPMQSVSGAVSPVANGDGLKQDRLKLFGNVSPKQESSATLQRGASASQTMSTMNEAHQRLAERGEKLSKLADKSGDLANTAGDFAKLAKQLKDQQKSSWF